MTLLRRVPLPIALVAAGVLVLLLVPRHVDLPIAWLSASQVLGDAADGGTPLWWLLEDLANIALFVPVGAVLVRALRPAAAIAASCSLSAACELAQHWIPNRDGSVLDVAMNAIGTVLGVLLLVRLRRRAPKREGSYATFAAPQAAHDQNGAPDAASTASMGVMQTGQFGVPSARSSSSAAAGSTTSSPTPASTSLPIGSW